MHGKKPRDHHPSSTRRCMPVGGIVEGGMYADYYFLPYNELSRDIVSSPLYRVGAMQALWQYCG